MSGRGRLMVTGNPGRHKHVERGYDLYETPPEATQALLRAEWLPRRIWEPCCGPGAIVLVLRSAGHNVVATDFVDYGAPDSVGGVDFLTETIAPDGVEGIVTNPPFRFATQFVAHALDLVPRVWMLLRLAFLESARRSPILDHGRLARVHIFSRRLPMMHRDGWTGPRASSSVAFAWFCWDINHRGPATLHRLDWKNGASADNQSSRRQSFDGGDA